MHNDFPWLYYAEKLAGDPAELNAFWIAPTDDLWEDVAAIGAIKWAVHNGGPYKEEWTPNQTLTEILTKQKRQIAQVVLWNVSTPHTQDIINKLWYRPSHKAATALYQAVLFNNKVCQGFHYRSQEQFFTPTPPPDQIEAWQKAAQKHKKELQEHRYAHEDAFIAKSLAKLGAWAIFSINLL